MSHVARIVEHDGPIEQIWAVVRSGVTAWLSKWPSVDPHVEGLIFSTIVCPRELRISRANEITIQLSSSLA